MTLPLDGHQRVGAQHERPGRAARRAEPRPRTLARAFASARTRRRPPASSSSACDGTTVKGTPMSRSSECRRGDCEARIQPEVGRE